MPDLFRVEVVAGLARRGEPAELLDLVDAMVRGPRFHAFPLNEALLSEALRIARAARIRAYDSVYVALALQEGAALLTLDAEVASRCRVNVPDLLVLG